MARRKKKPDQVDLWAILKDTENVVTPLAQIVRKTALDMQKEYGLFAPLAEFHRELGLRVFVDAAEQYGGGSLFWRTLE